MIERRALHLLVMALAALAGCSSESTRIAMDAQRRADEIQRSVYERQHAALRMLLFRDTAARLERAGLATELEDEQRQRLANAQRETLNDAWNDRDLFEFWGTQYERAAALRIASVDAKLAADQSIVDLLWKQWSAKRDRLVEGLAAAKGAGLTPATPAPEPPAEPATSP